MVGSWGGGMSCGTVTVKDFPGIFRGMDGIFKPLTMSWGGSPPKYISLIITLGLLGLPDFEQLGVAMCCPPWITIYGFQHLPNPSNKIIFRMKSHGEITPLRCWISSPRESRSFSHHALPPAAQHVSDPGPQRGRFVAGLRWQHKGLSCDGF